MKKLCYFFIFVLAILTTILCVEEFNSFYFHKITDFYTVVEDQLGKECVMAQIPYNDKSNNPEKLISQIVEFSDKNGYTAVISKGDLRSKDKKVYRYIYSREFNFEEAIYLEKNRKIDFVNKNENGYYTTDVEDKNATDIIHLLSDKYAYRKKS